MAIAAYITRRIALNATCDLINKHGYACLGIDYEGAARRIEEYLCENGSEVILAYKYKRKKHRLTYEWKDYE